MLERVMDLSQLVRSAQSGDERARTELVGRAVRLVYGRAYRRLNGKAVAEDVAQEALLKALEALPQLRNPDAYLPWLARITDNVLADHWKSRRDEEAAEEAVGQVVAQKVDASADRALERREDQERIRAALETLRPMNRLAIELFYFQELSSREVAYFLGVSDEAARIRLTRARRELKRSITTMAVTTQSPIRIRRSTTSSPGAFRGPVFEHDSTTARAYLALYPSGEPGEVASSTGLSREETARELALLERMGLVLREDDGWQCTMPVVDDTDMELMRLWATPVAGVIIDQLPSIQHRAAGLVALADGERAQSTVLTVALAEAARRPFRELLRQLGATAPDRGECGRFSAAVYTCDDPDPGFLTGAHVDRHIESEGRELFVYYLNPQGTSRENVRSFAAAFDLKVDLDGEGGRLETVLSRAMSDGIDAEIRQEVEEILRIASNRRKAFWEGLTRIGGMVKRENGARVGVAVIPVAAWKEYLEYIDDLGEALTSRVTDAADGLRRRAARCSFADCYFSDSVLTFVNSAVSIVGKAIDEKVLVTIPEEADLSWGVLIAA
jgi:RNA polymerase sigma-70 factor, ECF subfamily